MKIAIDFDGVLCKREGIPTIRNWKNAEPMEGSLETVKLLLKMKHKIWIFSSNPELGKVKLWLDKNNFPKLEVTNIKKPAHVYIDDRAIRFTNWQDVRKYFV